ncbi:iron-containing redox enzyme family protein [Aquihabitans sp. G128]|uniref:iron-containing redox enzyme family protein n=1 Tax=Aquihabitans sp. G128 TaxID=2849779 RepID=UPI001C21F9D9|nr:iron-containing redox enzyme family protein [Aquihabitans sp. G128]QXC59458.1 iron-containing redox enzyme family protein [Aquihabitans sp. G128]
MPTLPQPRGPLSTALFLHWSGGADLADHPALADLDRLDPLADDDLQLALWCCYAPHYRGFDGLPADAEWDPETIAFRNQLEARFEAALRDEHRPEALPADPVVALRVVATWAGPPLARTIEEEGERFHLEEFAIHRSAYQLKEADGHTFGLPRLTGAGRAAMVEIQADEYGGGRPGEAHSELFAAAMDELGLRSDFGHYVDRLPGVTLATDNLVSLFGLNRRLRGALVGHLALFEVCSVTPMSRYLAAARRVGGLPALERFYAVHVEADVHHARLALDGMVAPMAAAEPELAADIVFGAVALAHVEKRFARHVLQAWDRNESSLLPVPGPVDLRVPVPREPLATAAPVG